MPRKNRYRNSYYAYEKEGGFIVLGRGVSPVEWIAESETVNAAGVLVAMGRVKTSGYWTKPRYLNKRSGGPA